MKSLASGCWSNKEAQKNKIDKNLVKISWNHDHYMNYYHSMVASFDNLIKKDHHNTIMVSYEDIHESGMSANEKLEFMRDLVYRIAPNIRIMPNDVLDEETKECGVLDTSDNFINPEDFLISKHNIQIYLPKIA
jgi:hypothetical protein